MQLAGRIIAVTGATGFLGSHIALELARRGATVRGVVRSPEKGAWLEAHGVTFAKADLADPEALAAAFAGVDAVVANAALAAGFERRTLEDFRRANVAGTVNTLAAVAAAGVQRIVKVSTVAVYRTRLRHPMDEDHEKVDPLAPRRDWTQLTTNPHYAATKAEAERHAWDFAAARGVALTVLRPGPIYGPRDDKMSALYARQMRGSVRVVPTLRVPHVHAGDVAIAVAGALENDASAGQAYNVTGASVSLLEVARTWKRLSGAGPVLIPLPFPLWVAYDNRAAERDLGFRPRSLEDGLRDTIASMGAAPQ